MNLAVALAVVVLGLLGAALLYARGRARTTRLVDAMAAEVRGERVVPSQSLDVALARLSRAVGQRAGAVPDERVEVQRYRASLGALTLGVVVFDETGRVVFHNSYAASFLEGRHGDALVGQTIDEMARVAPDTGSTEREVQVYGPPRRTLYVVANPITENGVGLGAVVLIDDVTEQERLNAIRRDFVANISHELRTPIGAMSLLAETLADEHDPEVVANLAGRLNDEAARLAHTVDDLLQLSRIEHGSDEEFGPVVLQHVIGAAHDRVRAAAEQQGVAIGVSMPERDLLVHGDGLQLTSAVFNLLDNGVKYTGSGGGQVSVRARRTGENVELVVQDSGIGVPRKDLDRIFERFYRVDRGRSRASGGTGLGLAIVRHVVANHGGRISVDSTEGEGSTFTVELPALDPAGNPAEIPEMPSTEGGTPTSR